ncbi:MAG: hypothetical protein H6720_22980 [Sandaracinus sp.]|nr:hypothetical protein [Sandaracinus sp.]MCB9623479.1 hypothetical protein [Sandaracinus sp.]
MRHELAVCAFAFLSASTFYGCGDSKSDDELCAAFGLVPDPARGACRCPEGTVTLADGTGCMLMDGGVLLFPDAGTATALDAGLGPCRDGDERACPGETDEGACQAGRQRCIAGTWGLCEGTVGPLTETCNGVDDDCDGVVDGPSAASSCGAAERATGVGCTAGTCLVTTCATGWADCDREFENGCETPLGTDANCLACEDTCTWSSCSESGCNDAVQVSGGDQHSCAVREDGSVVCWGQDRAPAGALSTLTGVRAVYGGGVFSCALASSGSVRCWGSNVLGSLGDGTVSDDDAPAGPVRVLGITTARTIGAGRTHACALLESGEVWCWGGNDDGQVGVPGPETQPAPVRVPGLPTARGLYVGGYHSCALTESGVVWCWGRDNQGQLGGRDVAGLGPAPVRGLVGVQSLALGNDHSCALLSTGLVQCWGDNIFGQLGSDGGPDSRSPVTVSVLSDVTAISAAGGSHTCATQDGSVWCWGFNANGQAGQPVEMLSVPAPTTVGALRADELGVGAFHSCAVSEGRVWCWGRGGQGQLGTPATVNTHEPVMVPPPD